MENEIKIQIERLNFLLSEIDAVYHEAALKLGLTDSAMLIPLCGLQPGWSVSAE